MPIINQPFNGQLGNTLLAKLDGGYNHLIVFSAFAKNSGVLRLKSAIESYKIHGGTVTAFVGVDLNGTSYEALLNLFNICDDLYVVHSESGANTFHSKIYAFRNDTHAWIAIGSNNLTAGGLWTNFESCYCQEYDLTTQQGVQQYEPIAQLVTQYMDEDYECSKHITTLEDVNDLLEEGYVIREARIRLARAQERTNATVRGTNRHIFGTTRGVTLPRITQTETHHTTIPLMERPRATHRITNQDFANEQFWFEAKALTGGSRNILDLSKMGKIIIGSAADTRYETTSAQMMLGGVAFFDIDPEDTTVEKNITINFNGQDYFPSTIKYPRGGTNPNGSWRLQLKGVNSTGDYTLSSFGGQEEFVQKILVFEKVTTDCYCLYVVDGGMLEDIKSRSQIVAYNGLNANSRLFGML